MDQIHVMMSSLPQYEVQDDFSLLIRRPTAYNGGLYTLTASNGVAGPVAASTKVTTSILAASCVSTLPAPAGDRVPHPRLHLPHPRHGPHHLHPGGHRNAHLQRHR